MGNRKEVKLSAWEQVAIITCIEREMERGALHRASAEALLSKLRTLSKVKLVGSGWDKAMQELADMVGVRGSIPLAPTISECPICLGNTTLCDDLAWFLSMPCPTREDANSRERMQNTAHRSANFTQTKLP